MFNHADLHGDMIATTNLAGTYTWHGLSGPYGESATTTGPPDNTAPAGTSRGWHGADNKLTDGSIVHMGARPYSPAHGRFLAIDPIEGGCANNYTYVYGDPVNLADTSGRGIGDWLSDRWDEARRTWDNSLGSWLFTCDDTALTRVASLLSLRPGSFGSLGSAREGGVRERATTVGKLALTAARFGTNQAAQRIAGVIGATTIRGFARANLWATGIATGFDSIRSAIC